LEVVFFLTKDKHKA